MEALPARLSSYAFCSITSSPYFLPYALNIFLYFILYI